MNCQDLIRRLEADGYVLSIDRGDIKIDSRAGRLSPPELQELRANKEATRQFLISREAAKIIERVAGLSFRVPADESRAEYIAIKAMPIESIEDLRSWEKALTDFTAKLNQK